MNGNFETGDFTGWSATYTPAQVTDGSEGGDPYTDPFATFPGYSTSKGWYVHNGTSATGVSAISGFSAWNPFDGGTYGTVTSEPLRFFLRQAFHLGGAVESARLRFAYRYYTGYSGTVRVLTARIVDANGVTVATPYSFTLPYSHSPTEITNVDVDITSMVSGLASGQYTLEFESLVPQDYTGPATIAFDNISLDATSPLRTTAKYLKGEAVPNAGVTDSGIPADATWSSFGVPAINDAGQIAFIGKWRSPEGSGAGIFVDDELLVKTGQEVPGATGAVFSSLRDPVLAANGRFAALASIKGTGVTSADNLVVISGISGESPVVVAREGSPASGAGGATLRSFSSISVQPDSVVYLGALAKGTGTPVVDSTNDLVLYSWSPASETTSLRLRDGGELLGKTVKTFKALRAGATAGGAGRGWHQAGTPGALPELMILASFTDGVQGPILLQANGTPVALSLEGEAGPGLPEGEGFFKSYGVPAADASFAVPAFRAATSDGRKGIFQYDETSGKFAAQVLSADAVPDLADVTFGGIKDPVLSSNGRILAWDGSIKGTAVTSANDRCITWRVDGQAPAVLAREGDAAPGGGLWKSFTSIAISDATGPLLLGSLLKDTQGIDRTNDLGVWGNGSDGTFYKLFGEGSDIAGHVLKSFTTLKATTGSKGSGRTYNNYGQLVTRGVFVDGLNGILLTEIP